MQVQDQAPSNYTSLATTVQKTTNGLTINFRGDVDMSRTDKQTQTPLTSALSVAGFLPLSHSQAQCPSCLQIQHTCDSRVHYPSYGRLLETEPYSWKLAVSCWHPEQSRQRMQHPAEWLNHSKAQWPKLLSPSSLEPVPLAARPHICEVQQFHLHPAILQLHKQSVASAWHGCHHGQP